MQRLPQQNIMCKYFDMFYRNQKHLQATKFDEIN